jgi:type IV pilus assembly protein PilF
MSKLPAALAIALFTAYGCATQPSSDSGLNPENPTTGEVAQERSRARIHTELAAGYMEMGNLGVALEEIKEAHRSDPAYGAAYSVGGLIYAALKEDRLAEQSFQRALAINSNDHDANHNYGSFLCDRKREAEAIKYFLAAVRNPLYQNPDRSYVNAGLCSRRAGNDADAAEYFAAALKVRPAEPQALYQLADLAYAKGDTATAKSLLVRLTQAGVATPEVLWLGARVERRLGDRNAEASYARQLRNRYPNSAEARALSAGRFE